jgi:hypothetical protein
MYVSAFIVIIGANGIYLPTCTVGAKAFSPLHHVPPSQLLPVQTRLTCSLSCWCKFFPFAPRFSLSGCYMCRRGLLARFPVGTRAFFSFAPHSSFSPAVPWCKRDIPTRCNVGANIICLHHFSLSRQFR